MNPAKLLSAMTLSLALLAPVATGQTVGTTAPPAQTDEPSKAEQELTAQALSLLDEILGEAQSLKLPVNRVRLQATAAELLWPRDKERARELFNTAMSDLAAVLSSISSDDPQYYNLINAPA